MTSPTVDETFTQDVFIACEDNYNMDFVDICSL